MFFRGRRGYHGGGGNDIFVVMMFMGLAQRIQALPYKPPVTLALMAFMAFLHFLPHEVPILSSVDANAFIPVAILHGEWNRFWISTLLHASHTHLYYNLVSFLYKGVVLEGAMGSEPFAGLVVLALLLSQAIFLGASLYPAPFLGFHEAPYQRTVGWSGVIFALKVLVNGNGVAEGNNLGFAQVLGLNLPWNQVVWVELLLAHFLTPGSSFLGHLCGIVAGLLIRHVILPTVNNGRRPMFARTYGSGTARREEPAPTPHRRAPPPPPPPDEDEPVPGVFRHATSPPPLQVAPVQTVEPISAEELRARRLARFGQ